MPRSSGKGRLVAAGTSSKSQKPQGWWGIRDLPFPWRRSKSNRVTLRGEKGLRAGKKPGPAVSNVYGPRDERTYGHAYGVGHPESSDSLAHVLWRDQLTDQGHYDREEEGCTHPLNHSTSKKTCQVARDTA